MTATAVKSTSAQRIALYIGRTEIVWLLLAAPFFLFPSRWTPLAALLIGLTWLVRWLATGRLTVATPLNAPLLLLVGLTVISYMISPAPALSADKLWGIVLQVALYFAVVNSLTTEQALRHFTGILLAGIAALALLSLVGTDWRSVRLWELSQIYDRLPTLDPGLFGIRGSSLRPEQSLFNPRQVGGVLGTLLPFALVVLVAGRQRHMQVLATVALLSGGVILLLSQALMGWFGLAVALLTLALWRWPWLRWLALLGGGVALLAAWLFLAGRLPTGVAPFLSRLVDVNDPVGAGVVLRLDIWSRALAMIREMPFSGIGLNTFPLVQSHFYTGYLIGPEPHAHNLWLQLGVDFGLPGLLLFLWLLLAFGYLSYRAYHQADSRMKRAIIAGSAASMLAYVASGTLDVVTLGAKPLLLWWLVIGMSGAVWQQVRPAQPAPALWRRTGPTVGFVTLILLAWILLPAARWRNQGLLLAQPAIITARQSGQLPKAEAERALVALDRALALDPGRARLWGTRGSLYAWLGDTEAAYADLAQRVALDIHQPWEAYAPFLAWSNSFASETSAQALQRVYTQWLNRFPERAENYALVAILRQRFLDNPAAILQQGLASGAQPAGLLDTVADELGFHE